MSFQFVDFQKVKDGKYLKNYEITYLNKVGKEKKYEIVSHKELTSVDDIGQKPSGISIVATKEDKLLLLREFRMGANRTIFNLCAGMIEDGESIEECIARELYEETGLKLSKIQKILRPSFAAVSFSDATSYTAFVEVEGEFEDHTSNNEDINAAFYSKEEVKELLETEVFSSRSQIVAYFFAYR